MLLSGLCLSYPKHLSSTCGAHTLSCRPAILHSYASSIFHFPFSLTFHTVCLHLIDLLLVSIFQVLLQYRLRVPLYLFQILLQRQSQLGYSQFPQASP